MEYTVKDLIYMGAYVSAVVGGISGFRYSLKRLADRVQTISNIIFLEKGGLNIMDSATCKVHQDNVHASIRKEVSKVEELNRNVIKIMIHMQIEPVQPKADGQ